jgi:spore germination protein
LINKYIYKEVITVKEIITSKISPDLEENYSYIKDLLKDNSDVVFRKFSFGAWKAALIYIDGMADKILLDDYVLESLMRDYDRIYNLDQVKDRLLTVTDLRELEKLDEGINAMLSGDTLMLVNGIKVCFVIATRAWPARGVGEPSGETAIRGAREGFTETIRFNTALIRRRIRDTRLRVVPKTLGVRSKTDTAIMYIDDIVDKEILEEFMSRVNNINIDAVLDSGYVEQLIEDDKWSPFPQVQSTERPDVVAAALYEGRIAMIVDNSPFVLIAPATLPTLFQAPDDYFQRWIPSTITRLIRFISILLSLILPGFYIAVTSFHPAVIPTRLVYAMAATREGIPFPAFIETIIMEVSLALLIEAVARLPKPIGSTIGIVGGLIIGQAAVSAGIVSPVMIVVVAVTAITSFLAPNYGVTSAFRYARFMIIIAAAIIGLYGIMLGMIVLLIHLVKLRSFGIPYLSPLVEVRGDDQKDVFIRAPLQFFKRRPGFTNPQDKVRQK